MQISEPVRIYLSDECRRAAQLITEEDNPVDKTFYFSSLFGAAQRALNIEFASDILLLMVAAQFAHGSISARLDAIKEGRESAIGILESVFSTMPAILTELAGRISRDEHFYDLLGQICALGYVTSGNGFYLYRTGRLHI